MKYWGIIISCFFTMETQAQHIISLSLSDLLTTSLDRSHQLKSSAISSAIAANDARLAKRNRIIPNAILSSNAGLNWGTSFNLVTNERAIISSQNTAFSFNVQIPLFSAGQKIQAYKKGFNTAEGYENTYQNERVIFKEILIEKFFEHMRLGKIIQVLQKRKDQTAALYNNSKYRYSIGAISKDDLFLSHSILLEDENLYNNYVSEFASVDLFLKEQLGNDAEKDSLVLRDTVMLLPAISPELYEKNYSIAAQKKLLDNALLDKRFIKYVLLPQVLFNFGSSTRFDNRSSAFLGPFPDQLRNNLGYYASIGLSYNINTFFTFQFSKKRIVYDIQRQTELMEDLKRQQSVKIGTLISEIGFLKTNQQSIKTELENYNYIFRAAEEKLKYGKISLLDFAQLKSRYSDVEINYINTIFKLKSKIAILENQRNKAALE